MYRPELYFDLSSPSLAAISLSSGLSTSLVMLLGKPVSVRSIRLIFDIRVTKSIPGISELPLIKTHLNHSRPEEVFQECQLA